jgi:hypothetical protein
VGKPLALPHSVLELLCKLPKILVVFWGSWTRHINLPLMTITYNYPMGEKGLILYESSFGNRLTHKSDIANAKLAGGEGRNSTDQDKESIIGQEVKGRV